MRKLGAPPRRRGRGLRAVFFLLVCGGVRWDDGRGCVRGERNEACRALWLYSSKVPEHDVLLPTRVKKPERRRDSGTLTIAKIRRSPGSATSFERYVVGGTTSGEDGEGAESWLPGASELVSGRNAAHLKLGFWVN
ncbi:hypothetical protein B0H16DRAFT_1462652 [Mycena metata]|uniref:Secreted protein n=1 Tax=Mycena metata TaxID=1033252 RepID=A0AAD7IPD9_9AGAR|nr:hypothetical protein B0H16DRAFT_1462652 [Mycena metata]